MSLKPGLLCLLRDTGKKGAYQSHKSRENLPPRDRSSRLTTTPLPEAYPNPQVSKYTVRPLAVNSFRLSYGLQILSLELLGRVRVFLARCKIGRLGVLDFFKWCSQLSSTHGLIIRQWIPGAFKVVGLYGLRPILVLLRVSMTEIAESYTLGQ